MVERIDAHHHLWQYSKEEYDWIGPGMEVIARHFCPEELRDALHASGFTGSVAVQARQSLEETEWLLGQGAAADLIRGIVGRAADASAEVGTAEAQVRGPKKNKGTP